MRGTINTVCVYCGSAAEVDAVYKTAAAATGKLLAENRLRLVYGGENLGLMGILATACLKAGGEVTGIIPECLPAREKELTELIVVPGMHERKSAMVRRSDAFLVLPGGFGTLDETFETLTWKYMGQHEKPVIFLNIAAYFDPLFGMIDHMIEKKFTPAWQKDLFRVAKNPAEVVSILQTRRNLT